VRDPWIEHGVLKLESVKRWQILDWHNQSALTGTHEQRLEGTRKIVTPQSAYSNVV
jgi:hypothetical protein